MKEKYRTNDFKKAKEELFPPLYTLFLCFEPRIFGPSAGTNSLLTY